MSHKTKNINKKAPGSNPIVSPQIGNYEKHPFFVKKAKEARAVLAKVGLPKELKTKAN